MDDATKTCVQYALSRAATTGDMEPLYELLETMLNKRDQQWTWKLGITDRVLTPEEFSTWLENDRVSRARNVAEARQRPGPVHW